MNRNTSSQLPLISLICGIVSVIVAVCSCGMGGLLGVIPLIIGLVHAYSCYKNLIYDKFGLSIIGIVCGSAALCLFMVVMFGVIVPDSLNKYKKLVAVPQTIKESIAPSVKESPFIYSSDVVGEKPTTSNSVSSKSTSSKKNTKSKPTTSVTTKITSAKVSLTEIIMVENNSVGNNWITKVSVNGKPLTNVTPVSFEGYNLNAHIEII
jgi:hypothetical protein